MNIPPGPRNSTDSDRLPQQPQTLAISQAGRAQELFPQAGVLSRARVRQGLGNERLHDFTSPQALPVAQHYQSHQPT